MPFLPRCLYRDDYNLIPCSWHRTDAIPSTHPSWIVISLLFCVLSTLLSYKLSTVASAIYLGRPLAYLAVRIASTFRPLTSDSRTPSNYTPILGFPLIVVTAYLAFKNKSSFKPISLQIQHVGGNTSQSCSGQACPLRYVAPRLSLLAATPNATLPYGATMTPEPCRVSRCILDMHADMVQVKQLWANHPWSSDLSL